MNRHVKLIFDFMVKNNLTQYKMAHRLEITPASLSRWLTDSTGITAKNQKRIEFICGDHPVLAITDKIIEKLKLLSEEDQWKAYDYLIKNFSEGKRTPGKDDSDSDST